MLNGNLGTPFICEMTNGFFMTTGAGENLTLMFDAEDLTENTIPEDDNAEAQTTTVNLGTNFNPYLVIITINSDNCNDLSVIQVFETIQHELIHADIRRRLIEQYDWDASADTYVEAFTRLVQEEYGGVGMTEHQIMVDHYVDEMVESLIQMNGGIGTEDNFAGLVLNGFPIDVLNASGISLQDVQNAYADYLVFIAQPGNISSTLPNCE